MPRPFGVWAPATTLAELHSRIPGWKDWSLKLHMSIKQHEYYYQPEALAWFKDPQQYKDAVDTLRKMRVCDKFFGDGCKWPEHCAIKTAGCLSIIIGINYAFTCWVYGSYAPANNPTWRKIHNKEWDEAVNNSPWDHMSHAWGYSDTQSVNFGCVTSGGPRKFIIPA
jgi:hypothetical protein